MEKILQKIERQLVSKFSYDPNVIGVMLFGSYASGRVDAFSDIDVYVLLRQSGKVDRRGFFIGSKQVDVLFDSLQSVKAFLQQDHGALRRPTSQMLAFGKILFERTDDLRKLQQQAQRNLLTKSTLTKNERLMHAYSLQDFFDELQRDAKKEDAFLFAQDLSLFVNNAIECVLHKQGSYLRRTDETRVVLRQLDPAFVRFLEKVYRAESMDKKIRQVKTLLVYLVKNYGCQLPKRWSIGSSK